MNSFSTSQVTGKHRPRRFFSYSSIVLFSVLLCLPGVQSVFRLFPEPETTEQRRLAQQPRLSVDAWRDYPKQLEGYFNDHFGFRNLLIQYHALFKVKISPLPMSPSNRVIVGKQGWYFYNSDEVPDGYIIKDRRGLIQFSEADLETIRRRIEEYHLYFREQGIPFLVVIAPNKSTIYPEYMPDYLNQVSAPTRLDQIDRYLKEHSDFQILDVRRPLAEAKATYLTHHRTGTHWNNFGAFIAYREIMNALAVEDARLWPYSLSDFDIHIEREKGRGLARMMGLAEQMQDEQMIFGIKPSAMNDGKLPRLILYSDSFSDFLVPFFENHFEDIQRVRSSAISLSEQDESPSAVILEIAERYLGALLRGM